jgi:hypothetical protein
MTGIRFASVAAVSAVVLGLGVSSAAAGTRSSAGTVISGTAGASTAACLAHVPGGLGDDRYVFYRPGCTGHDEPELDPVSSASRSAQNITWRVQLPDVPGIERRADVLVRWYGQGLEPAQDRPGGVPGTAVLSRLLH